MIGYQKQCLPIHATKFSVITIYYAIMTFTSYFVAMCNPKDKIYSIAFPYIQGTNMAFLSTVCNIYLIIIMHVYIATYTQYFVDYIQRKTLLIAL